MNDVDIVLAATESYRQEQDVFLEFHNLYINPCPNPKGFSLHIRDIQERFKDWYTKTYNNKNMPNGKEVQKYFEHRYGRPAKDGWKNISFKSGLTPTEEDIEEEHFK